MKGKAEACPCFLFPQAPQPSPLLKWHHLWLPGVRKAPSPAGPRSFMGLWLGLHERGRNPNKFDLKHLQKKQTTLKLHHDSDIPNSRAPSHILEFVHCLKDLQANWCVKNKCNEFVACFSHQTHSLSLVLPKLCLWKRCWSLKSLFANASWDVWFHRSLANNLWVNVCCFIVCFSMYHVTQQLLGLSFHIGRLRHVWNRLTCDGTVKDGHRWPKRNPKEASK